MLIPFGSKNLAGVDIGTASIKVAEIKEGSPKSQFLNYGVVEASTHLERQNEAFQTSSLKLSEKQATEALKELFKESKINTKNVVASIPSFSSFTTFFNLPLMNEEDTRKAMSFQIKKYLPLPISEVKIEWIKVGERDTEIGRQQEILLISVPKEQIIQYQNIFKMAGLNLKALEIESLALARAFTDSQDSTPVVLVDIGCYNTNIVVVENGYLKYNNYTGYAGNFLTRAIANGLGIDIRRAEEIKKSRGLLAGEAEYELSTLLLPFLDAIIGEVKRAINNYQVDSSKSIKKVILVGGGANLLGIEQYFERELGLKTEIGNALNKVNYPLEIEPMAKEIGSTLGIAIGLGLHGF